MARFTASPTFHRSTRGRDRSVGPVLSTSPLALTTSTVSACARLMAAGASIGAPFASCHAPGAYQREPSGPRVKAQGEKVDPGGAMTQRPGDQAQRAWRHTHSPSTQTAPRGSSGIASTRPGGGGTSTATSALVSWRTYVGWGSDREQADGADPSERASAAAVARRATVASGSIRMRLRKDWSTTIGRRRA